MRRMREAELTETDIQAIKTSRLPAYVLAKRWKITQKQIERIRPMAYQGKLIGSLSTNRSR